MYLDYAATTPLDARVLAAMMPFLERDFANPSSLHSPGQHARGALDISRETIAHLLNAQPQELIFTGGGTESNNLFIRGVAEFCLGEKKLFPSPHIITTTIEHDSVLAPIKRLQEQGCEVTFLDVNADGFINPDDLKKALRPQTILVSIMYANNEIGTIQPIAECAKIIAEFRSQNEGKLHFGMPYLHTDACQVTPYLKVNVGELGVDALTINAGKMYGPKGVGALYVRGGAHGKTKFMPQLLGGGQEYRMRAGTENVAGIVGFAKAFELVAQTRDEESLRQLKLRDELIDGILTSIPTARLNGGRTNRLPNNVNVSFKGLHGEAILIRLDMIGICASSGSACSSGSLEPSHVIQALGGDAANELWSRSATRFSLGSGTTSAHIEFVLKELPKIITELNAQSPLS